jgi:hypothetical protein
MKARHSEPSSNRPGAYLQEPVEKGSQALRQAVSVEHQGIVAVLSLMSLIQERIMSGILGCWSVEMSEAMSVILYNTR